uniref:Uncharacterized protein n=1 Tax=Avena sativa TaxID=4498 RepID=A0ACD5WAB5_AVESA
MANPEASKPPGQDEAVHKDGAGSAPPPPFLEVTCRSSGVVRRFAAGTTARYALHAVNRKLAPGAPAALHVEAAKDGEEPVCFGPTAPLADYGRGWRLQTVTEQDAPGSHHAPPPDHTKKGDGEAKGDVREREALMNKGTSAYLAKIGLAFVFMFLIGGLFTYLLETIPDMIQHASTPESL